MDSLHKYQQYFGHYRQLTGERLRIAKKVFLQDVVLGLVLGVSIALISAVRPQMSGDAGFVALSAVVVWGIMRLVRKETYIQLRIKELHASSQDATIALEDLHNFAKSLDKNDKDGG